MTESVDTLRDFLDGRLGDSSAIEVEAMVGGGSCEIFGVQRGRSGGSCGAPRAREFGDRS